MDNTPSEPPLSEPLLNAHAMMPDSQSQQQIEQQSDVKPEHSFAPSPLPARAMAGLTDEEAAGLLERDTDFAINAPTSRAPTGGFIKGGTPGLEGWHAFATALLYLVVFRVSTLLPFTVTSTIFVTLAALVIVLVFTVRVARAIQTPSALTLNFALSAGLVLPLVLTPVLLRVFPAWAGWPRVGPIYGHYRSLIQHVLGLKEVLLMWFAACIGVGISRLVREMKMLLPMAATLAFVDVLTVFGGGIVDQAVSGKSLLAQTAMDAMTVQLPSTHSTAGSAPIQLRIGFADFLFIALFFACFKRFGVAAWNTFVVLCATLSLYMLVVAYKDIALPALVPIGAVVIGMNLRQFRYERSEAFALLYAALLVSGIGIAFWLAKHH